jgi:hypothetical protein
VRAFFTLCLSAMVILFFKRISIFLKKIVHFFLGKIEFFLGKNSVHDLIFLRNFYFSKKI